MKKELTPQQKADLKMKYEIAEELGLLVKFRKRMERTDFQREWTHRRHHGKTETSTETGAKKREKADE